MKLELLVSYIIKNCGVVCNSNLIRFNATLKLAVIFTMLFFGHEGFSQCANYQNYESFGTAKPTSGGTWTDNSATYNTGVANSGVNQLQFDAVGDYIVTPLISNPGIFLLLQKVLLEAHPSLLFVLLPTY
ncbi:MAG: hypothetical protein IPN80_09335 [Flavobacterium sp.]|nr:hypothetical protein [Flavobacterium sp.]